MSTFQLTFEDSINVDPGLGWPVGAGTWFKSYPTAALLAALVSLAACVLSVG